MIIITPKGTKNSKLKSDIGLYLLDDRSGVEYSVVICRNEDIKHFSEVTEEEKQNDNE